MRRVGMFLLGLLVGLGVGLALALLFTPASGEKLRREAQEYYEQLLAEARRAAEERRLELEKELNELTSADTGARA